jgi:hypothetical protein
MMLDDLRALAASQSAAQILADAIGARLPTWVFDGAIYLPTQSFKTLHKEKYLAKRLGRQIVREKLDTVRQGLEFNNDVCSLLRQ